MIQKAALLPLSKAQIVGFILVDKSSSQKNLSTSTSNDYYECITFNQLHTTPSPIAYWGTQRVQVNVVN